MPPGATALTKRAYWGCTCWYHFVFRHLPFPTHLPHLPHTCPACAMGLDTCLPTPAHPTCLGGYWVLGHCLDRARRSLLRHVGHSTAHRMRAVTTRARLNTQGCLVRCADAFPGLSVSASLVSMAPPARILHKRCAGRTEPLRPSVSHLEGGSARDMAAKRRKDIIQCSARYLAINKLK